MPFDLHIYQLLDIKNKVGSVKVSFVKLMTVSYFCMLVCLCVCGIWGKNIKWTPTGICSGAYAYIYAC